MLHSISPANGVFLGSLITPICDSLGCFSRGSGQANENIIIDNDDSPTILIKRDGESDSILVPSSSTATVAESKTLLVSIATLGEDRTCQFAFPLTDTRFGINSDSSAL